MEETGQEVLALKNRPTLTNWTFQFYEAFVVLHESRTVTMAGAGPIPLSEVKAYLDLYEVHDLDDVDRFIMMIRALDSQYLKISRENAAKNKPPEVGGSKLRQRPRGRMRNRGG